MLCPRCGWKFGGLTKAQAQQVKTEYPNAYLPWMKEDDKVLEELYLQGKRFTEIAGILGRQPSAIGKRLDTLKLLKESETVEVPEKSYLDGSEPKAAPEGSGEV